MKRLLTIIGARPQIIKAAAISREIKAHFADKIEEVILHTGQHYDDNMSEVFFRELGIPQPKYNLQVGSGSHAEQTGKMLKGIEAVLQETHFDGVIIYGDTNSTLAGALAASKLQVPIYHIEAGLRSYNMSMPEEINRIIADRLASILFAPTQLAVQNLKREGLDNIVLSGDIMYDNSVYFSPIADKESDIIERLGLQSKKFVLATIHRPANTDNEINLRSIFRALRDIADDGMEVVIPLHPRTRERLTAMGEWLTVKSERLRIIEPVSFFEIIRLEKNAAVVLTDSGGVQKESFFYGTPCVILRSETEWQEIVDAGAGIIADADYDRIIAAYKALAGKRVNFPPLYGDGNAAHIILNEITTH